MIDLLPALPRGSVLNVSLQLYRIAVCVTASLAALTGSVLSVTTWTQLFIYGYLTVFSIGIVAFGALATRRLLLVAISSLLAVPLFIRFGGSAIVGMPETSSARISGQTLPVVTILCLVVLARVAVGRMRGNIESVPRGALDPFIAVFSVIVGVGAAYGLLRWQNPLTTLYAIQTIAPFAGYVVARRLLVDEADVRRAWNCILAGAGISAVVLLANEVSMRPIWALFNEPIHGRVGLLNIYQANDYLPFLWAFIFVASSPLVLHPVTLNPRLAGALGLIGICVGALYARGALLLLMVGLAIVIAASPQLWRTRRHVVIMLAAALVGVTAFAASPAGVRLRDRTTALVSGNPVGSLIVDEASLRDRFFSMRVVVGYVGARPIFAAGFTPVPPQDLSRRIASLPPRQLFPAHNQYLDVALRGGLPLLFVFLVLLGMTLYRASLAIRAAQTLFGRLFATGVAIALVMTVALGNMYEQNHIQPFTGFFLWFVAGSIEVLLRRNHTDPATCAS